MSRHKQRHVKAIKVHHFQKYRYEFIQQLPQRDLQSGKNHGFSKLQNYKYI